MIGTSCFSGFMATGDDTVTPNLGLLDQRQSLVFVQENIRAFGGDPDSVTIFGQSAGASSVGIHMMSPKSAGDNDLFGIV